MSEFFRELTPEQLNQANGGTLDHLYLYLDQMRKKYGTRTGYVSRMTQEEQDIANAWLQYKPGDPIRGTILEGTLPDELIEKYCAPEK